MSPLLFTRSSGGSGPPPFSPLDVANCIWWARNGDSATMSLDGSNGVDHIIDQSPSGNNLSNASSPKVLFDPIDNCLVFDGASRLLAFDTNPVFISDNPWTLVIIFQADLTADFQGLFSLKTSTNSPNRGFGLGFARSSNGSYANIYFGNIANQVPSVHAAIPSPANGWHYAVLRHLSSGTSLANYSFRIDGVEITTSSTVNASTQVNQIGNDDNGNLSGKQKDWIFYGQSISGSDLTSVETYCEAQIASLLFMRAEALAIAPVTNKWKKRAAIAAGVVTAAAAIGAAIHFFL